LSIDQRRLGLEVATLSVEKQRVYAYLHVPADATYESAMGWLSSQTKGLSRPDREAICSLHLEDGILRDWRAGRFPGALDQPFLD